MQPAGGNELFGGIEAGGTKIVCAVGTGPADIRAERRIPTTTADETIPQIIDFFKEQQQQWLLQAVGIASFGPADPDPSSPTYGYITTTPKPGWHQTPFATLIQEALSVPVAFDTDVNVAALGEYCWGAGRNLDDFIYLTIGTGIGGGGLIGGEFMHGLIHPEMGHMRVPHDWDADPFPGNCPFHGDCLEGLAAGPAINERWGEPAETLAPDHPAWALEADYLALALTNLVCVLSPRRIVMGGGVMKQTHLFPMIREKVQTLMNNYVQAPALHDEIDRYIVPPALGDRAGVLGALAFAEGMVERSG